MKHFTLAKRSYETIISPNHAITLYLYLYTINVVQLYKHQSQAGHEAQSEKLLTQTFRVVLILLTSSAPPPYRQCPDLLP